MNHPSDVTGSVPQISGLQAPGYYRLTAGNATITAISDGALKMPLDKLLTNISPEKVAQRMALAAMTPETDVSVNAFVVDTGEQRILIDTGAGQLPGYTGGHLQDNLRAAGYPPESIDLVLLTHIHSDHFGSLTLNGTPVFPNAQVKVSQEDARYWLDRDNLDDIPESRHRSFHNAQQVMERVRAAGQLQTFDLPAQVHPLIRALPAPGHTPGSVVYLLESGAEKVLFWGDIIHAEPVQMQEPHVAIQFDIDQNQAIRTRETVLAEAAREGYLVGAAHIAFPGIGRVVRSGEGYRWIAVS